MSSVLAGYLPHLDDDPRFRRPKPLPVAVIDPNAPKIPAPPPALAPLEPYAHPSRNRYAFKQPERRVVSVEPDPRKRGWWIVTLECTHSIRVFYAQRREASRRTARKCRACVEQANKEKRP